MLEWVTNAPRLGVVSESLYHVALYTRDLARSTAFYREVLGLDLTLRTRPSGPRVASEFPAFGPTSDGDPELLYDAVFLSARGDLRAPIDLLQWIIPSAGHGPYSSPFNLGIQRLAYEVDDVDAAYEILQAHAASGRLGVLHSPETWDFGELGERRSVLFEGPDGEPLELIERAPFWSEVDPYRDQYPPLGAPAIG